MLARTVRGGGCEGAFVNARIVPTLFVSTVMTCWKRERRGKKKKDASWGGKRRAEKKEGARALVWIDVWAWADVRAAGQPVDGARPGCLGGWRHKGPSSPPSQPLPPGTRSPHHPPTPLGQLWGRVSGAGARVWGLHPDVPLPGCATQGRLLSLSGLYVPSRQNEDERRARLLGHFQNGGICPPSPGCVFLSLGRSGHSHWDREPVWDRVTVPDGQLGKVGLVSHLCLVQTA